MITTGSNTVSLGVQRRVNDVSRGLNTSFERLSSGLRINRAVDDAAGLAIADSLNADSRVYGQAIRNVNDGVSALSIADGALSQLSNIVIRQKELAEQAANGVYSTAQRTAMHTEANALVNEFNRIVGSAAFNGQNLLDGSYVNVSLQAGYGTNGGLRMGIGDDLQRAVGDGTFAVSLTLTNGMFPTYINAADFNGDGNNDLLTSSGAALEISYGNGDGTFLAVRSTAHALPNGSSQQIIGDFNGDAGRIFLHYPITSRWLTPFCSIRATELLVHQIQTWHFLVAGPYLRRLSLAPEISTGMDLMTSRSLLTRRQGKRRSIFPTVTEHSRRRSFDQPALIPPQVRLLTLTAMAWTIF